MRFLSFDTSSSCLHLCLSKDGQVAYAKRREPSSHNRQEVASILVPEIDLALNQAGWTKEELDCLVVGQGPGSFTGIRVGLVTARTLAQALQLPLFAVSIFECFASRLAGRKGIILGCGTGLYFAAAFSGTEPVLQPVYLAKEELHDKLAVSDAWFADKQALADLSETGLPADVAGPKAGFYPLPEIDNLATIQAQIAWDRLSLSAPGEHAGKPDGLAERYHWSRVEPLYLRGPSVTVKRKDVGHSDQAHDS